MHLTKIPDIPLFTVVLLLTLLIPFLFSNCDPCDNPDGCNPADPYCLTLTGGGDVFFSEYDEVVTHDEEIEVDTVVIRKFLFETDTLSAESFIYRFADTLFLLDDEEIVDTVIFSFEALTGLDPDEVSSATLEFDSLVVSIDSTFIRTVISSETVSSDTTMNVTAYSVDVCTDNLSLEQNDINAIRQFLEYMIGEWEIDQVTECGTDVTDNYAGFVIRFDLVSVTPGSITFRYRATNGTPLFFYIGTVVISTNDHDMDEIEGTKDVTQDISFKDVGSNRNNETIEIELPEGADCGEGGRLKGVGIANLKGKKKKS